MKRRRPAKTKNARGGQFWVSTGDQNWVGITIYATCAVLGANIFEILIAVGAPVEVAVWAGLLSALILRLAAIRWHLGLPVVSFGAGNNQES